MPVKFALDLDAINSDVKVSNLREFVNRWQNCGVMVYPAPKNVSIEDLTSNCDQSSKTAWQTIWKKLLTKNDFLLRWESPQEDSFTWETISCNDLAKQKDKFDVVLLGNALARKLGIPNNLSKLFGQVEGVRFVDMDLTKLHDESSSFLCS